MPGVTLRLYLGVEEQLINDRGEKSTNGAEYVLMRLHDKGTHYKKSRSFSDQPSILNSHYGNRFGTVPQVLFLLCTAIHWYSGSRAMYAKIANRMHNTVTIMKNM